MMFAALSLSLGGCTAVISQASFYPSASLAPPDDVLAVPDGYTATDTLLPLGGLGAARTVRLDDPASETGIIYSAGNGGFVDSEGTSRMAARPAEVTGADIILYDYPGRGGTTLPPMIAAAAAFGPAMMDSLKAQGWIEGGPVYAYGLSFGGSMAASLAQSGGLAGLIIAGRAADYRAVGRDFVLGLAKPFVKLRLDPALNAFDYQGYVVASRAPVLLLSATRDKVIRPARMREFQQALEAGGTKVALTPVPVGHGGALEAAEGRAAFAAFIGARQQAPARRARMPKAIIVGGGIAGLASGIAFANAGWGVTVLERAPRIEPMGAALSLWPNACAAMARLGILGAVTAAAAPIRQMLLATQGGATILARSLPDTALLATRTALQNALLVALGPDRLQLGCEVSEVAPGRVTLASGEPLACDLVVDAGGIRAPSSVGSAPAYAGYGGVLALSGPVAGSDLGGVAAEYWGRHQRFGVFELPDNRRYWFLMRT